MRKIILTAALLCVMSAVFSQSKVVQQFFERYRGLENVENVKLRGWMLRLASDLTDSADEAQLLRKISRLQILATERTRLISKPERQRFLQKLQQDKFEKLITIKKKNEVVTMLIREENKLITDLILMVSGGEEFVLVNMEGTLRFRDLNDLNFNIKGAEYLQALPDKKSDIPRA